MLRTILSIVCCAVALLPVAARARADVTFTDVTAAAGLLYTQHTPPLDGSECDIPYLRGDPFCGPPRMSGGAAVGDFDADGWEDLFVTRFNESDLLFRNNGNGTFTEMAETVGITLAARTNGALWVDVDQDGDLDLLVNTAGERRNLLWINDGTGHFSEEGRERGFALDNGLAHLDWALAAGDYDGDGWVDLFTAEWAISFFDSNARPHHSRLLRNLGPEAPGYFVDVTDEAGVNLGNAYPDGHIFGFAATFTDLDVDGHLDLAVTSDYGHSTLYWNNGDGTFTNGTAAAAVATDENGMGATFGDYDGDGDLDWFVTSIYEEVSVCSDTAYNWGTTGNRLYQNNGDRTFTDATDAAGLRAGGWGWGTAFFDYDNDADLDVVMTNGAYFPNQLDCLVNFTSDPMRLWENDGAGGMTEVSVARGITDDRSGKGLLTWDYDRDGDLDLFVVNNTDTPVLYRNDTENANHWLRVRFADGESVHEGLNARIALQTEMEGPIQIREMGVATHFLGQSERVAHFGLGETAPETLHALTVTWPRSGIVQTYPGLARDTEVVLRVPQDEIARPDGRERHDADFVNADGAIGLNELLRLVQFYNAGGYHRDAAGEDGFAPGADPQGEDCHEADYAPADWRLSLSELLRAIQLFSAGAYRLDVRGEDGFAAVVHP